MYNYWVSPSPAAAQRSTVDGLYYVESSSSSRLNTLPISINYANGLVWLPCEQMITTRRRSRANIDGAVLYRTSDRVTSRSTAASPASLYYVRSLCTPVT